MAICFNGWSQSAFERSAPGPVLQAEREEDTEVGLEGVILRARKKTSPRKLSDGVPEVPALLGKGPASSLLNGDQARGQRTGWQKCQQRSGSTQHVGEQGLGSGDSAGCPQGFTPAAFGAGSFLQGTIAGPLHRTVRGPRESKL